ncbi:hypothetical protein LV89_01821 [Arcicella aurantiaca]|uniref:Uncharacterized protein n=1 Tax=Arcicella aurantiaca TaxID=591202 RepID=A0A316EEC1_9BACT|nr:hypothetical protein [Arcicella aurantiaca]PWK27009.1 hypothetical protein LV89_01821 [Arcicella aurantiaca]
MPFFSSLRPQGISRIEFTDSLTHIKFKWDGKGAVLHFNRNEFERLSPEVRYFVIMHEVGHLKTMTVFSKKATLEDEEKADNYALQACLKAGMNFKSVQEVRQLYANQIK